MYGAWVFVYICHKKYGTPFFVPPVNILWSIWTPPPLYFWSVILWTPQACYYNYNRDSEGSGAIGLGLRLHGVGLVSMQGLARLGIRICMQGESKYFGDPNTIYVTCTSCCKQKFCIHGNMHIAFWDMKLNLWVHVATVTLKVHVVRAQCMCLCMSILSQTAKLIVATQSSET